MGSTPEYLPQNHLQRVVKVRLKVISVVFNSSSHLYKDVWLNLNYLLTSCTTLKSFSCIVWIISVFFLHAVSLISFVFSPLLIIFSFSSYLSDPSLPLFLPVSASILWRDKNPAAAPSRRRAIGFILSPVIGASRLGLVTAWQAAQSHNRL